MDFYLLDNLRRIKKTKKRLIFNVVLKHKNLKPTQYYLISGNLCIFIFYLV